MTLDDVYTPATTVESLKKLAEERNPTAFLGLFGVPMVAAALPVLLELKIQAVGLISGTDALRAHLKRYAFPMLESYADKACKLVNHVRTVNTAKVSVIYTRNPFGESVKNILLAAFKDAGLANYSAMRMKVIRARWLDGPTLFLVRDLAKVMVFNLGRRPVSWPAPISPNRLHCTVFSRAVPLM